MAAEDMAAGVGMVVEGMDEGMAGGGMVMVVTPGKGPVTLAVPGMTTDKVMVTAKAMATAETVTERVGVIGVVGVVGLVSEMGIAGTARTAVKVAAGPGPMTAPAGAMTVDGTEPGQTMGMATKAAMVERPVTVITAQTLGRILRRTPKTAEVDMTRTVMAAPVPMAGTRTAATTNLRTGTPTIHKPKHLATGLVATPRLTAIPPTPAPCHKPTALT